MVIGQENGDKLKEQEPQELKSSNNENTNLTR